MNLTLILSIASFLISVGSSCYVFLDKKRKPHLLVYWAHADKATNWLYFRLGIYNSAALPLSITRVAIVSLPSRKTVFLPAIKQVIAGKTQGPTFYSDTVPLNVSAKVSATGTFAFPNLPNVSDYYDQPILIVLYSGQKVYRLKETLKSKEISTQQLVDQS
ncbi:hypothetical protein PT274_03360 [Leuconostocaceae bacterium ESL0958]|nr:hypothetical protein [Leuconostocaceae bacterium ESL0958]